MPIETIVIKLKNQTLKLTMEDVEELKSVLGGIGNSYSYPKTPFYYTKDGEIKGEWG